MLEIYNEKVRDLLVERDVHSTPLRIREDPAKGFYVADVCPCTCMHACRII